jgi:hypothetical protein
MIERKIKFLIIFDEKKGKRVDAVGASDAQWSTVSRWRKDPEFKKWYNEIKIKHRPNIKIKW